MYFTLAQTASMQQDFLHSSYQKRFELEFNASASERRLAFAPSKDLLLSVIPLASLSFGYNPMHDNPTNDSFSNASTTSVVKHATFLILF